MYVIKCIYNLTDMLKVHSNKVCTSQKYFGKTEIMAKYSKRIKTLSFDVVVFDSLIQFMWKCFRFSSIVKIGHQNFHCK